MCVLTSTYSRVFFSSKVLRPIFGPWPPWCRGFKIHDILQGGDVNPMPNSKSGGPCPVSRSNLSSMSVSTRMYIGVFFSSKVLQPIFGPWPPPWCQGFKIVNILRGGDVNPTPNSKPGGPCPVSHSKSVQHECPYQHVQCSLVEIYLHFGGTNFLDFFHYKAGGSWSLQLVGKLLLDYIASHPRGLYSLEQLMREPQNLRMFTAHVTTLHLDCCYDDT